MNREERLRPRVTMKLWPAALEAFAYQGTPGRGAPPAMNRQFAPDDPRAESRRVAASRARSKVRRYVVANALTAFLTLTSETGEPLTSAMGLQLRRCRHAHDSFPYVWVEERGGRSGRWHIHSAMPRYVADELAISWSIGFTNIRPMRTVDERRIRAEYMAKDFETPVRNHRYRVARGFQPEEVTLTGHSLQALIAQATDMTGCHRPPDRKGDLGPEQRLIGLQWAEPARETIDG